MGLHEKLIEEARAEREKDPKAREVYEVVHMQPADARPACGVCKDSGWLPRLGNFGERIPCGCPKGQRRRAEEEAYRAHRAHARHSDPETSHQAAASVKDITAAQKAVHDCLKLVGERGCTDVVLIDFYRRERGKHGWPQLSDSGIRTRRKELSAMDPPRVVDTGRKEKLPSGRNAIVWRRSP